MRTLTGLLTAALVSATLTAPQAHAAPSEVIAEFEQNLVSLPPHAVEGELAFTDIDDDKVKVTGSKFENGFASDEATDYRWVLVDDKGEVAFDLTKDIQAVIEVEPPQVADFEVTLDAKTKDLLGLDAVVYQVVNIAGAKLLAEIGRTEVKRAG